MNSSLSPVTMLLVRWTALLMLGWVSHGLLGNRHPQWRLILWRSIFCFGLVMPLAPFSLLKIPLGQNSLDWTEIQAVYSVTAPPLTAGTPVLSATHPLRPGADTRSVPRLHPAILPRVSWKALFVLAWGAGALWAGGHLIQLHIGINRLRASSVQAGEAVQQQARDIAARLKVSRRFAVWVSDRTVSPCVCGIWKPAILLPKKLVEGLPGDETPALLAHEIAHLRRHDLFWCAGWRWAQALIWPHPLVWAVPAAHSLACEEETDRIAAGQLGDHAYYSQLLARLALRILAPPKVETQLALNGGSQIAQRIRRLGASRAAGWTRLDSVAAFGLVAAIFVVTAGCSFKAAKPAALKFKEVMVVVLDQDGTPLAGATIHPEGFRVKGVHHADAYPWNPNDRRFGPATKSAMTAPDGKAYLTYPVEGIPEEKEFTSSLFFSVSHPGYSTARPEDYSMESANEPIRLSRGELLKVSGYFGTDHQPVTELAPNLTQFDTVPSDWQKMEGGELDFDKLSPGNHLLQLMGRRPSGEIVYSDTVAFTAEAGKPCSLNLEMKPGIRVEGRLDDRVPRPVKNGRVLIAVRPKEFPAWLVDEDFAMRAEKYGYPSFWRTYRTVNEDGTFVFESIPPGELDVIAIGDGFVSRSIGRAQNRINGKLVNGGGVGIPQTFALNRPVTEITVQTESTATLDFTATTRRGEPIEGASVYLSPNVLRIGGIFGEMRHSSEEPFRRLAPLPQLPFAGAKTDNAGNVEIRDIPSIADRMNVFDSRYQVPLQDPKGWRNRQVRLTFSPGVTNELKIAMENKGADFIDGK